MSFGTDNKRTGANNSGSDEWYTPEEAVTPLLRFLPNGNAKILCPFDTEDSAYVKVLSKRHRVIHSHISEGVDFFKLDKPKVDYVISNPPYSCRTEVIKRLYEWDLPFAMMFNSNGIFDNKSRFELARKSGGNFCSYIQEYSI